MKKLWMLILTLAFAMSSISFAHAEQITPYAIDKLSGKKAPDFTLKDLAGKDVPLSSFKGKPVLLNFWATWCPYCREERPALIALNKEYKGKGLIIAAVATDKSANRVKDYLKKTPMDFVILMDDGKTAESYGVYALPTSFFIGRDGTIRQKFMGGRDWLNKDSRKMIDNLLK
ncbi:MAG: TlpA family protein disulfide reductase [Nitrospirae bacterium]|nr:TlpA family protein disulfide reductase [Nitrospirota bacterium]